jgi:hypothetical protein
MIPLTQLLEITFSDTHTVDREAGVIRGVKVLGRESRNGREYSDRALHEAARHYEGIGVNLNHPDRRDTHLERPVEAGFGWLEEVEVKCDGVYADLHYLRSHGQAAVLVEAAERNPRRFGLSHNAEGKVARRDGRTIVESIENVRSVDVVQNPATNNGLFESEDREMSTRTVKEVFQEHDGRLTRLFEDAALAGYSGAPVELPADADPDDQVALAFKSMIGTVLDDDSLDLKAKLAKIRDILKAQEKLTGGEEAGAGDGGETAKGPAVAESAGRVIGDDPTVRQLLERLERLETEASCRALLEVHRRTCDATRLKALGALASDAERIRLIESWPERSSPASAGTCPRPAVSRPLIESGESVTLPKDAKSLAMALR